MSAFFGIRIYYDTFRHHNLIKYVRHRFCRKIRMGQKESWMKNKNVAIAAILGNIIVISLIVMNVRMVEGELKKEDIKGKRVVYEQSGYSLCARLLENEKRICAWSEDINYIIRDGGGKEALETYFKRKASIWAYQAVLFIGKDGSDIVYSQEENNFNLCIDFETDTDYGKTRVVQSISEDGSRNVMMIVPICEPIVLEKEYCMIAVVYGEKQTEFSEIIGVEETSSKYYVVDKDGDFIYAGYDADIQQKRKLYVEELFRCNTKNCHAQGSQGKVSFCLGNKAYHMIYQPVEAYSMMIEMIAQNGLNNTIYSIFITLVMIVCASFVLVSIVSFSIAIRQDLYMERKRKQEAERSMELREYPEIVEEDSRSIKQALDVARKISETKSRTLSVLSHEIRTPLNTILGLTRLAEQNIEDPDRIMEYVRKIESSGKILLTVVNNVLDIGQIENGRYVLNEVEFSLTQMLDEISTVIKYQAKAKEQLYTVRSTGIEHDIYVGDKMRLSQVIMNLLSNAVKYTANSGAIMLSVTEQTLQEKGGMHSRLHFEVKDNGCGMSKEYQKSLFEPYSRENNEAVSQIQGTGLGMAIAKSFVELMGGTITVDSEIGAGTTIAVEVVLQTRQGEFNKIQRREEECEKTFKAHKGFKILIADDYSINADMIAEILEMDGIEADVAGSGKEALEMFMASKEKDYTMILMDIKMPVMNGYDAAKEIRKLHRRDAGTIPILAMTAGVSAQDIRIAYESGMNDHIPKPIDIDELKQKIKMHAKESAK